jgi:hypothetical protein
MSRSFRAAGIVAGSMRHATGGSFPPGGNICGSVSPMDYARRSADSGNAVHEAACSSITEIVSGAFAPAHGLGLLDGFAEFCKSFFVHVSIP